MPRINRVRLHNIRYGKERRVLDDIIFDLRGRSGLLILENGGGKTLILQLISQVVCPNAPLGKRRLATLVRSNPFTGHVLVEWLLDADAPAYILTGFCFAENTGSANRDMDYFNYLSAREYSAPHSWDLESLPLVDEDGRTLNYREHQEMLRRSGQFRIFSSDRRREYQRDLRTYNINPEEWERVLETNSDEGGVGKFFENCSRTRSLLEKLFIPAIDDILGRGRAEDDLTRSFQQASSELMHLPEFQAHMQSLSKLGERIGVMQETLSGVECAAKKAEAAKTGIQSLFNTLVCGLPRLADEQQELQEKLQKNRDRAGEIQYLLDSVKCETLRRRLDALQNESDKKKREKETALRRLEDAEGHYNRLQAWDFYGRWLEKDNLLKQEEAAQQRLLQGHESVAQEIEALRHQLWPLFCRLKREIESQITVEEKQLESLQQEMKKALDAEHELNEKMQSNTNQQTRLEVKSEEFAKRRAELAGSLQEVGIETDLSSPENAEGLLNDALQHLERKVAGLAAALQESNSQLDECSTRINILSGRKGELGKGLHGLSTARGRWQQDVDRLRELLTLAGLEWLFPLEDFAILQRELEDRRQQSQQSLMELEFDKNRIQERQRLLSGDAGAVPNNDILLLQDALSKQGVDTITGALFLRNLPGSEERRQLVQRYPWFPYALIAEQGQLQRMMRRSPELRVDLSAAVPVAARSSIELSELSEEGVNESLLCFFHNQGVEPFIIPEKLDEILFQLGDQLEQLTEKRKAEEDRNKQIRLASTVLANLLTNYEYHTAEEWEQVIENEQNALRCVSDELEAAEAQEQLLRDQLDNMRTEKNRSEQHLLELRSFKKPLEKYRLEFQEENDRKAEMVRFQQRMAAMEAELGICKTRQEKLDREMKALQEQNKATLDKLDRLEEDNKEFYPSTWEHPEGLIPQDVSWEVYRETADNLRARKDALSREVASLKDVERLITGYKKDMGDLQGYIKGTGLDFTKVKNSYRPVSKQELDTCRREVDAHKDDFQKADKAFQDAVVLAEGERGAWKNQCKSVVDVHQHEPADLKGIDLDGYRKKLNAEKEEVSAMIAKHSEMLSLLERLQQEYRIQVEDLTAEGLELTDDPGWETERELKELTCDAGAPRRAAKKEREAVKEALQKLAESQEAWHQVVDSCWQELDVLNNLDIRHLFTQLKDRTTADGWERDVLTVQESLCHVGRVISKSQEELERRLKDLDRIKEEITERAYRHVENILEELKTLQRMSRVELRGSSIPLMEIDFRRPSADEGKELVRSYLADVIASAVQRRQEGESEEDLQQYLEGAVRSAALLEQLVPLDGIKLTVLKPRSDDQPYQSLDYDRWENLAFWSGAQKYIGRFAVFVALMAYLREKRKKEQRELRTSVIIADNPFGEASSGHILEILRALTQQAGIQLFCVTAHRQTGIMKDFPVIYSLVSRPTLSGQQRMVIDPEKIPAPGAMEAARGMINDAEKPSWKMDIDGQLKLF